MQKGPEMPYQQNGPLNEINLPAADDSSHVGCGYISGTPAVESALQPRKGKSPLGDLCMKCHKPFIFAG